MLAGSHPILDCAEAAKFEREYFAGDEKREWGAMRAAGRAVARGITDDLKIGSKRESGQSRVLVLVGKGHNGGDAMLAAAELLESNPAWMVELGFVFGQNRLRPLALAAWRELQKFAGADRVRATRVSAVTGRYEVIIDGLFGFQFRPPLPELAKAWIDVANRAEAKLRVAVDLPSGWAEPGAFCADATYATGILKRPLWDLPNAGRLRYLDLGFWGDGAKGESRVLTERVLDPLRELRPFHSDKRSHGHLAIIGGSRSYPGAVAMSVAAALQSGVGLVTAFVPESLAGAFAARWPEAMWVGCPETPDGNIAMESSLLLQTARERATAWLIGPGLGREAETMAWVADVVGECRVPMVLDADALQPELVRRGSAPRILTPHQGEFDRIMSRGSAGAWPERAVTVLKGPVTRIWTEGTTYHSVFGGPVLARGGSGDLLAGLIGGRLATNPNCLATAAAQGVVWHGLAADALARSGGEVAVRTTALLDELCGVLRHD